MSEPLTFSELRKIQKQEARQDDLSDLDEHFLLGVANYFSTKKEMNGEDREYRNAKRVFEKIIALREDKIVKNAKIASKSNMSGSKLNLLPFEQQLFRDLKSSFKEHRATANERIEDGSADIDMPEPEPETEPEEDEEEIEEGYEMIKITSGVPEFMGTDLETYGPYDEGEEVKVPEDNAEILVNRGNAEKVEN